MLDISAMEYKFSLANIVVQPGDTVRFEQTGSMPHNVEFKTVPAAAKLGAAMSGRYLTVAGETYDLVIDNRFVPGEYHFICLPHETMGMKGILTVSAGK